MKKKNVSVLLVLMILLVSIPKYNFAEEKRQSYIYKYE